MYYIKLARAFNCINFTKCIKYAYKTTIAVHTILKNIYTCHNIHNIVHLRIFYTVYDILYTILLYYLYVRIYLKPVLNLCHYYCICFYSRALLHTYIHYPNF